MENKNFRKRYFFFDIDGTLAVGNPGRYIPKSAKDAIEKLESQGHFCAIATGRSQAMAFDYCQEIGFNTQLALVAVKRAVRNGVTSRCLEETGSIRSSAPIRIRMKNPRAISCIPDIFFNFFVNIRKLQFV